MQAKWQEFADVSGQMYTGVLVCSTHWSFRRASANGNRLGDYCSIAPTGQASLQRGRL